MWGQNLNLSILSIRAGTEIWLIGVYLATVSNERKQDKTKLEINQTH